MTFIGTTLGNGDDDTAPLQAALDIRGVIRWTEGNYSSDELTIFSDTTLIGDGIGLVTLTARASIGTGNQIQGIEVENISISGIKFDGQNTTIAATLTASEIENQLWFLSVINIEVFNCEFIQARNRGCGMNGSVANPTENVFFHHNIMTDGSTGGFLAQRENRNIHVYDNRLLNTVDSTHGGVSFNKPITVNGVVGVWIYNNDVEQDNGEGGSVIVEYIDRQSENVHIYDNSILNLKGGNGIKLGPCLNAEIYGNTIKGSGDTGIYIEGSTDVSVHDNYVEDSFVNSMRLAEDGETTFECENINVYDNTFINANVGEASIGILAMLPWETATDVTLGECRTNVGNIYTAVAAGTTGGTAPTHTSGTESDGSVDWTFVDDSPSNEDASYHILVRGVSNGFTFKNNEFSSTGLNLCNGIKIGATLSHYWIQDNDLTKLRDGLTTLRNDNTVLPYVFDNNSGAQNRDSGEVTVLNGASAGNFPVDVIAEGQGFHIQLSAKTFFNSTIAYAYADVGAPSRFDLGLRDATHLPAITNVDLSFYYNVIIKEANGFFGKTKH